MPKTLEKTRKQIAKKRHGTIGALHQRSRDSQRLHRAQVRDERLSKLAAARRKRERPLIDRTAHFQTIVRQNGNSWLAQELIQEHIKTFVHQYDDQLETLKKERRPGRPPTAKEDMLKAKIAALETEYKNGFLIPDLTDQKNIHLLDRWDGPWSYLTTLRWIDILTSVSDTHLVGFLGFSIALAGFFTVSQDREIASMPLEASTLNQNSITQSGKSLTSTDLATAEVVETYINHVKGI